jgi:hypothetical protein
MTSSFYRPYVKLKPCEVKVTATISMAQLESKEILGSLLTSTLDRRMGVLDSNQRILYLSLHLHPPQEHAVR